MTTVPEGKVQCVTCRFFSLQKHEAMAREGFGKCAFDDKTNPGKFHSAYFPIICTLHAEVLPSVSQKRLEWLDDQRLARAQALRELQAKEGI